MNLQQLRTLVAIHDHSGFVDAAASVFLTPAAISQQMRGLEDELQVTLFDRTTRPPRLTPHAVTLVDMARDVLAKFDAFAAKARAEGEIAGTLTLGSATGITSALVPKALAALREKYPRMQVRIEEGLTDHLISRVRRRAVDAAIITEPLVPEPGMEILPITTEPLMVVAPKSIKDRGWKSVLTGRPFLRLNRKSGVGVLIDVTLRRAGVVVNEAMELDSSESIVGLVAAGLGVGVVPAGRLKNLNLTRLRTLAFGTPHVHRRVVLIERNDETRSELAAILYRQMTDLTDA